MNGLILKDDARYQYTENYLQNKGHIFHKPDVLPQNLDFVIFPFKEVADESIFNNGYFAALRKSALVFSGLKNDFLAEKCAPHDIRYYAMMEDNGVKVKNAIPTSEGVIAYLVYNLGRMITNSRMLVIGYGVCGRDLSLRLTALGANVHALVRNREKECAAYADSVAPVYIDALSKLKFDAIINTVPGIVLTDEMLGRTNGALLIDIASKPYGFNMELAKKLNSKSALLPGIPGKYAVQTAGEILGEYINFILRGMVK